MTWDGTNAEEGRERGIEVAEDVTRLLISILVSPTQQLIITSQFVVKLHF